jgi:hypothetical protein
VFAARADLTPRAALSRALLRLDALLAREVGRLRARYQLSLDEFRGLFISDEQIDALLGANRRPCETAGEEAPPFDGGPIWSRLANRFGLSILAQDLLLLAVAADVDAKYAPIVAYLNDDVTLRWPTFDLARRLFANTPERAAAIKQVLAADGPLFGSGLVANIDRGVERRPVVTTLFAAAPAVIDHLLGAPPRLTPGMKLISVPSRPSSASEGRLGDLEPLLEAERGRPLVLLQGEWGVGREAAAAQLAGALGHPLLRVELGATAAVNGTAGQRLAEAVLIARLAGAALFIAADEAAPDPTLADLASAPIPVFIATPLQRAWPIALRRAPVAIVRLPMPDTAARHRLWSTALAGEGLVAEGTAIGATAARFRLTRRRIAHAAAAARVAARVPLGGASTIDAPALLAAARDHATLDLGSLAEPIDSPYGWDDLVLPAGALRQLHDLADAVKNREHVFRDWGFVRAGVAGLAALFAGGSGTGKTMSVGVIARETGFDLWRIDLSAVVSKYIGETEKHLERIFAAARDGNAILFFDEADALFGRRSEVKDAHDRYANIEVAYLLQRLEAHEGVSILASNLSKNVDPAFSRRMHAVIDFPLPDAPLRERLWRSVFPAAAPVADDIDFAFLARQFAFSGGDIRVAALDAAFLAAARSSPITMAVVVQAVARQLLKQGKIPSATEFRQHYPMLLGEVEPRAYGT